MKPNKLSKTHQHGLLLVGQSVLIVIAVVNIFAVFS
jgi:hypothetical protein